MIPKARLGFTSALTIFTATTAVLAAGPAFAATGSIVDNGSGGLTVTYSGFTGNVDLYMCATSIAATSCTPLNATYVWGAAGGPGNALSSSPATITVGMNTRTGSSYNATTVAAGTYNVKLFDAGSGGSLFSTTLSNAVLGGSGGGGASSSSSGSSAPSPIVQQFGKPMPGTCADGASESLNWSGVASGGWGESWAQWVNGGNGGAVCTRTLVYSTAQGRWIIG